MIFFLYKGKRRILFYCETFFVFPLTSADFSTFRVSSTDCSPTFGNIVSNIAAQCSRVIARFLSAVTHSPAPSS